MKSNLLKYLMFIPLVCFVAACSDDDPEQEPLKPAYIEFETAEDASFIIKGDAQDITVVLNVNREDLEITNEADWVKTATTLSDDKTAVNLKISVDESRAAKKRVATLTLTTKTANEEDKAATPLTITITQSPFGLVEADLLDLVFDAPGNGPNSARDISPLANPVLDVLQNLKVEGCAKEYPIVSMNEAYGRNGAHFIGPNSCSNNRGSCAYRIDIVDYSNYKTYFKGEKDENGKVDYSKNTQILPIRPLGYAIKDGSFSIEVIFIPEWNENNNDGKLFGFTNSWGGSIAVGHGDGANSCNVNFYLDAVPDQDADAGSRAVSIAYTEKANPDDSGSNADKALLPYGKAYHVVGVFDKSTGEQSIYLDGKKGTLNRMFPKTDDGKLYAIKWPYPKSDYAPLAQWIGIGANTRRSAPIINGARVAGVNSDDEDWAQNTYKGEIVLVRMYSKALSDTEIKTLYDYEKPEVK